MKKLFLFSLLLTNVTFAQIQEITPEILAQKQLNGYNARDIEAFLEPYADDVEIYTFPNTLRMKGKDEMRKSYDTYFQKTPNLHCEIKTASFKEIPLLTKNTLLVRESLLKPSPFIRLKIIKLKGFIL